MAETESGRTMRLSLDALYSIASTINSSLDLLVVLQRALGQLLKAFDLSSGVVRLLDLPTGELRLTADAGLPPELASELSESFRVGDAPFGLAAQRRALVVVEDLAHSPYADSLWARHGYRTFISVPLQSRGMLLGCLNLFSSQIRPLSDVEQEWLGVLGNQISIAVANADLYTAAQRKIEYLSALQQCSQDIGPAPDLERVLRLSTERMADLLRLQRTILVERDPATEELAAVASHGYPEELVRQCRAPQASLSLAASVLRERQVRVSTDPASEGLLPAGFVRAAGMHSAVVMPLVAHDVVLGLLIGDRGEQPLYLSADEIELAMIFAHQAAVWIANARLFVEQQAALALAEAVEAKFRGLVESAPDGIVIVDPDGKIVIVNSQLESMFGYRREELLGMPIEVLMPERLRVAHQSHRTRYQAEPRTRPMGRGLELYGRCRDGSELPVEISLSHTGSPEGRLVTAVVRDITERQRAEEERARLLASEREKSEQLKLSVREAHHRIKNNLQAITALLYMELSAADSADGHHDGAIRESMERIQAIALVHDLLTQDKDVQTVDMRAVVERLVPTVLRSSGLSSEAMQTNIAVPALPLSSKKATALALILNELVSNAAKHAFADRRGGCLQIRLSEADDGLLLRIQDDGPGLPPDFELSRSANVGLEVVRALVERDLDGRLTLDGTAGLAAEVWFPW